MDREALKIESVITVLEPISADELGFCHCHEHLFIAEGHSATISPALHMESVQNAVRELELFKAVGGRSIVDAQPVGCGRMADALVKVAQITKINIIASTGFHKLEFYPSTHWLRFMTGDNLFELFVSELTRGMYVGADGAPPTRRIPGKAGIIKVATDASGLSDYQRFLEAAARASLVTGAPILSHTEMGKHALEQIQFLLDRGVPNKSIIICHMDRSLDDLAYHYEVAGTGVYLEYDTIGRWKYHTDEEEAEFIVRMVEAGHENQMLLGLDSTRKRLKSYGGRPGLDYIAKEFLPLLKKAGLSEVVLTKLTVSNPSKALTWKARKEIEK